MPDEVVFVSEFDRVTEWRQERLLEAGYPQEEAFVIAGRHDIDLHCAIDLLRAGCPLKWAFKILL